jgi:hypothetical protein
VSRSAPLAALLCLVAAPAWGQTAATPAPTRLWAAQTTANQITLVWTGAAGATGYLLYRDAGGGASQPKVATLAGNVRRYVYIVRSAAQEVQQFHLEATGAGGSSPKVPFNPVTLVSGPVPPVAPASVTATASSATVITLSWTAVPGATAYLLGRAVGTGGFQRLCDFCSTATTFVDSTVTPGVRHVYSVAVMTPSGVSTRVMSNPLIPGVTSSGGTGGTGVTGVTGGTGGTGGTGASSTPAADPLKGRYRVTLTGFTVQSQSLDNPLQLDGKGDEVYLATHVMAFDTASAGLVVDNLVRTSRIYGDVNGFTYRVKAGTAGLTGGLRTGDSYPVSSGASKSLVNEFPMVLWEGTMVQGQNAVVLIPTIWEWDNQVDLFGNWLTGRHALLSRLLQTDPMVALLTNGNPQPMEVGAGGLFVRSSMFGDARDRPIGLRPGQPAKGAGFYAPLPPDPKGASLTATYLGQTGSVVDSILPGSAFASFAATVLGGAFGGGGFNTALGGSKATIPLATSSSLVGQVLAGLGAQLRPTITAKLKSQQPVGLNGILTMLRSATASTMQGVDLYLFEQMVVLTPQAIANAMAQAKGAVGSAALIDVPYVDSSTLQGKYLLHLKVEKL